MTISLPRRLLIPIVVGLCAFGLLTSAPQFVGRAHAATSVAVGWYPVDPPDGLRDFSATNDPLQVRLAAGGAVKVGLALGRYAVQFPAACPATSTRDTCPRAILEAAPNPAQNPGTQAVRFGAVVAIPPGLPAAGQNIMQKGVALSGSQFKVQVDGAAGRPSCVLAGGSPNQIYRIAAPAGIADGGWHSVECQRSGGTLTVVVDGLSRGSVAVPLTLSIVNSQPLRIGGKDIGMNADLFHGYLDAAWIFVG